MSADLYLDLGTSNTLIAGLGRGLLLSEPTVISFRETHPGHREVLGVGFAALEQVAQSPGHVFAWHPLREGVIADSTNTDILLGAFLSKVRTRGLFRRHRLVFSLPYGVTEVEKRAAIEAGREAGMKEVILVDEPMVGALGAGLPIEAPLGSMIVDIGGGTSEVAVIALADIVYCQPIRTGGHRFDELIRNYLKRTKNLIISAELAEKIKIELGTAMPRKQIRTMTIEARDFDSGLLRRVNINSEEIGVAMDEGIRDLLETIHRAIEHTPPELVSDLIETGIMLTGGGSLIRDLAGRIEQEIRLPVRTSPTPLIDLAKGGELLLQKPELLAKIEVAVE